jgi:hypothetical protein
MKPYHKPHGHIGKPEEKLLHPSYFVPETGVEICHDHVGKKIIFTAWYDGEQVGTKTHEMDVKDLRDVAMTMTRNEFYAKMVKEIAWLCVVEKKRVHPQVSQDTH